MWVSKKKLKEKKTDKKARALSYMWLYYIVWNIGRPNSKLYNLLQRFKAIILIFIVALWKKKIRLTRRIKQDYHG